MVKKIDTSSMLKFDMTPMIDCTFQLVIFFMLTLNYSMEEQDERIKLPSSELAKPMEAMAETNIMLQMTKNGMVLIGGDEVPIQGLRPLLDRERQVIVARKGGNLREATIVIRGDAGVATGKVQEVIQIAQKAQFEKFVLRAQEVLARSEATP